jgi:uncharacterized protein YxeA
MKSVLLCVIVLVLILIAIAGLAFYSNSNGVDYVLKGGE